MKPARVLVRIAPLAAMLVVICLSACGEPLATPELVFLRASGSEAMVPLVSELADGYRANTPTVSIEVAGRGSQYGVRALESGEVDMALVSWLPENLGHDWHAAPIARDGLAIIVHPDNPVDGLGLLQLQDLFSGRAYDWGAIGRKATDRPVLPVIREAESGDLAGFLVMVMEDEEVTPRALVAASGEAVLDYVGQNRGAIGFVAMEQATANVKVLEIESERPTPTSTADGSYPLSRELYVLTAEPPAAAVQVFLDFARGPAGQQIVGRRFGRMK